MSRWRALVTLVAIVGLFSSSSLVVIAQDATPAVPPTEPTASEQTSTGADEQFGGEATTDDSYTEPDTTADTSSAGTFETSSVQATDTGDAPVVDGGPPILPNTDWLSGGADPVALDPGQQQAYAFTYGVTTHRTGTAVHAELRHADGTLASGWGLSAQAGGSDWIGGDAVVDVSEWGTLVPDTAFTLSVIVTAPAEVTAKQAVSLFIRSTARGETETGVVETGPLASLTVVPPPIPNTDTLVATSSTEPVTLEPGGSQQYTFAYSVTTPRTGTGIVADLRLPDGSPATGWTITAQAGGGEAATGDAWVETGEWATLAPGTFTLTVTVTAPEKVDAEQTVSLYVSSTATNTRSELETGIEATSTLVTLTVVPSEPKQASGDDADFPRSADVTVTGSTQSAQAASVLTCTPASPAEVVPTGSVTFTCTPPAGNIKVKVATPTDGWRYDISLAPGWKTDPYESGASGANGIAEFTVTMQRMTATAENATGSIQVEIVSQGGGQGQGSVVASTTLSAVVQETSAACSLSVNAKSVEFSPTTWDGSGYPSTAADLELTISATGENCSGAPDAWSIQVSTDGMAGESNGGAIPPDAIAFTGGADTPAGLTAVNAPLRFANTLQPIASGDSDFADSHTWNAALELTPPNDAMPDDYSGTITISIVNGQ